MSNRYGIEETARYFGHNVIIKIAEELEKQRAEFLDGLNWIMERVEFHTENPDSELMDELLEEFRRWEERK